jgi:site-specific recombinase XerD
MVRKLSDEEVAKILEVGFDGKYALRNRTVFLLGLLTGYRISELLSLTVGSVCDTELLRTARGEQNIIVFDSIRVDKRNMKGKQSSRSVPLSAFAKSVLFSYLSEWYSLYEEFASSKKSLKQVLFPSRKDNAPLSARAVNTIYKRAFTKSGVLDSFQPYVLGTHSTRKTFAYQAQLIHGNDLLSIQKSMGHKVISSTMSYIQYQDDKIVDGIINMYPLLRSPMSEPPLLTEPSLLTVFEENLPDWC